MKIKLFLFNLFLFHSILFAQEGFMIMTNKNKVTIPFQFINNLIIIPVEVNGISLNFLLDTGVEQTILFSLEETEEVSFTQIEKIKIRGFGNRDSFEGLKSINNTLNINGFKDINHTIYLILDQDINISSQVGVPVNGILGRYFFDNNLIKIDYSSKKITIYKNKEKLLKRLSKSYTKIPIELNNGKPYLYANLTFDVDKFRAKLLIDIGNSDAIWLFKKDNPFIKIPTVYLEDFLGRGFNGDIFGKRGRIKDFEISNFNFANPLVAFPDESSMEGIDIIEGRSGSVGSEIISRFTVVFDYYSKFIYLRKNNSFDDPFNFNMTGLEIQHQGVEWVKESYQDKHTQTSNLLVMNGENVLGSFQYKFELKPVYVVTNVRKNSPADLAGLKKDDIILTINGNKGYNYSLQDINRLIKSQEDKVIEFTVDRKGNTLNFKVQLKSII